VDQLSMGGSQLGDDDDVYFCARKTDATAWCWGFSNYEDLGTLNDDSQENPTKVIAVSGPIAEVAAGGNTTCVRKMDNTVWCWGYQVGHDPSPQQLTSLGTSTRQLSGGADAFCARKDDGTLWCWGSNFGGAVGDGTTVSRAQPVQVPGLTDVAEVAAGTYHTCARTKNGTVWCWGYNGQGQLGDATTTTRSSPVRVNVSVP